MTTPANIFKSLLSLQDRHQSFFAQTKTTIVDYLIITWSPEVCVILKENIPAELLNDVKSELGPFLT